MSYTRQVSPVSPHHKVQKPGFLCKNDSGPTYVSQAVRLSTSYSPTGIINQTPKYHKRNRVLMHAQVAANHYGMCKCSRSEAALSNSPIYDPCRRCIRRPFICTPAGARLSFWYSVYHVDSRRPASPALPNPWHSFFGIQPHFTILDSSRCPPRRREPFTSQCPNQDLSTWKKDPRGKPGKRLAFAFYGLMVLLDQRVYLLFFSFPRAGPHPPGCRGCGTTDGSYTIETRLPRDSRQISAPHEAHPREQGAAFGWIQRVYGTNGQGPPFF